MNLWLNKLIAFAYQYQRDAKPYKDLIFDFSSMFQVKDGETVLDIGCGSGRLIRLIYEKSEGKLRSIIGLDNSNSAINYAKNNLKDILQKIPYKFVLADISNTLPFSDNSFSLITAGLSLQYAEYWDGKRWTDKAYRRLFKKIYKILKKNGKLVFSVNTPNPDFSIIAKESWKEIFFTWRLPLNLFVAIVMVLQGRWLTKQSEIGRFHYLPIRKVINILEDSGFRNIKYKLTYAGLAWAVACEK